RGGHDRASAAANGRDDCADGKERRSRGPDADSVSDYFRRVGRILWLDFAPFHIFEGCESGDVEAAEKGGCEVRSWHGFDFALVSLHAGSLYPGAEEFCGRGVESGGGAGRGHEKQFGNSGHG